MQLGNLLRRLSQLTHHILCHHNKITAIAHLEQIYSSEKIMIKMNFSEQ
jgi:hypothetical protein